MKKVLKVFKKIIFRGLASILATLWVLGIIIMINDYVEWTCANNIRFVISSIIGIIIIFIMISREASRS